MVNENNECVDIPVGPSCEDIPHYHELCDGDCQYFMTPVGDLPVCTKCRHDDHLGEVRHIRG